MQNLTNEQMTSLYTQHKDKAYAVALYALKNPHDAEDAVQDSFLTAFQNVGQLRELDKFEPWLMRIVTNRAKDMLKKKKPDLFSAYEDPETGEEDTVSALPDDAPGADVQKVVEDAERRQLLLDMLETLREDEKLCVLMFYEERMRIAEIAETLGVQEYTVKNYLAAAKKKLRRQVEEKEKQGYTLRGFSGLAITLTLRWLLSTPAGRASLSGGPAAAVAGSSAAGTAAAGTSAAAGSAGTAAAAVAGSAAAAAGATAAGGLAVKIAAVVVAAALLATGGVLGKKAVDKKRGERAAASAERTAVAIAQNAPGAAPNPAYLDASAEELELLSAYADDLCRSVARGREDGGTEIEFDSARPEATDAKTLSAACINLMLLVFYKGDPCELMQTVPDAASPSGYSTRYSGEAALWTASHVLNLPGVTAADLRLDVPDAGDGADVSVWPLYCSVQNANRQPDGSYIAETVFTIIRLDGDMSTEPLSSTGTIHAALMEEDGVRYWRIFSMHGELKEYTLPVPQSAQSADPRNLEATAADLEKLGTEFRFGSLLTALNFSFMEYGRTADGERFTVDFDAERDALLPPGKRIFRSAYSFLYSACFGEPQSETTADEWIVIRYPERDIEFLARNVLNNRYDSPDAFAPESEPGAEAYSVRAGDELWVYCTFFGARDWLESRIRSVERLADGSYRFTVEYAWNGTENVLNGEGVLCAALREENGARYWSVFSYQTDFVQTFPD